MERVEEDSRADVVQGRFDGKIRRAHRLFKYRRPEDETFAFERLFQK
jgi:hypothetical protein